MNTEFNWWLLIVGLVIGAGVVWLILSITRRDEADVTDRERESEARWIAEAMRQAGRQVSDLDALDVLRLHEAYLAAPPPDEIDELAAVPPHLPGWERPPGAAHEARAPMAHRVAGAEPLERGSPEP